MFVSAYHVLQTFLPENELYIKQILNANASFVTITKHALAIEWMERNRYHFDH